MVASILLAAENMNKIESIHISVLQSLQFFKEYDRLTAPVAIDKRKIASGFFCQGCFDYRDHGSYSASGSKGDIIFFMEGSSSV
jgi:hypothetical protein